MLRLLLLLVGVTLIILGAFQAVQNPMGGAWMYHELLRTLAIALLCFAGSGVLAIVKRTERKADEHRAVLMALLDRQRNRRARAIPACAARS
jgi:hypothetical protein